MSLNLNSALPLHKDCSNHSKFPNGSVGLGSYSQGELWMEESERNYQGVQEQLRKAHGEPLQGPGLISSIGRLVFTQAVASDM